MTDTPARSAEPLTRHSVPLSRTVRGILTDGRFWGLLCGLTLLQSAAADDPADSSRETAFGPTAVWSIHLELSAEEYQAMQPPPAAFGVPGGPPPQQPSARGDGRDSVRNLFGTEFPWAKGSISIDGQAIDEIAVRYSGGITYLVSGFDQKRPLAIQLNRFSDQELNGVTSLELRSMPMDPAKAREALAFAICESAGVDAPGAAFAEVTLTVPGVLEDEYLGLYTVVEGVDAAFLTDRFGNGDGLLMQPFGMQQGLNFLGDEWNAYAPLYRPQREATAAEAERVIAFARLINEATDDEFAGRIGDFLDVDAFLRFLAANALTSNLESFFALGHNYYLYLDSASGKFHFIPESLEFSVANFLLMGTPEQLMDLSLTKPYPGQNRLPDRLLAIDDVRERYLDLLREITASGFAAEQLRQLVESIESATQEIREKEAAAVAARPAPPPGFGGFGQGQGPQPPDLATFVTQRTASVTEQLTSGSTGFIPEPFSFGPPPGGDGGGDPFGRQGSEEPITDEQFEESVETPEGFTATLFAKSPDVNYPVAIAAEPSGAIYVAIDEQGSLGRTPGGGRIVRCVDADNDGRMDDFTVYARVDHPRGVVYRNGSLWVMHPPTLSVFHDDDGDGVSDRQDVLVTGLTTSQIDERGGDHSTNCVRMGIDGWLYIGVGDYGILHAEGVDGRTISQRGGGIVRVRPDGTELEVYCTGLRNPFDIAIDPFLNLFTRDNTNDGAGWDTRVSLMWQTAEYGYPRLFANFTDEIMPTLGAFGGGGGTGGLFIQDPRWPEGYNNTLLTGDWGTSQVYRHPLTPHDPTFDLEQEVFLTVPRATGMDIDGNGRLYVASWWSGEASVYVGPHVGFVARIVPADFEFAPFPDLKTATLDELMTHLAAPEAVTRMHAQGEILARGRSPEATNALIALASDSAALLEGRVAAIFTLKQLDGREANEPLITIADDSAVRAFALRALTDRVMELGGLDAAPFVAALADESPRVRAQALISLGRLGELSSAASILPLTTLGGDPSEAVERPHQNDHDPARVVPHLAIKALVALDADEACLEALDGPHWRGALWAMRYMHNPPVVEGLIQKLRTPISTELRREILATLIRLYQKEADYDGSWWGIRPDSSGPYYDRVQWEASDRIASVVTVAVLDADADTSAYLERELRRHGVSLAGLPREAEAAAGEENNPIVIPAVDPNDPNQIGNIAYDAVLTRVLAAEADAERGLELFRTQSCIACHTTADGQTPKGPHMFDIGRRYRTEELVQSILKPGEKIAQGYEMYLFSTVEGLVFSGFVVSERADATVVRETNGVQHQLLRTEIDERIQQPGSAMPDRLVNHLTPEQLADLIAYLQSLK